jgi:hypothetical protein
MNSWFPVVAYHCMMLPLVWISWARSEYLSDMEDMSRTEHGIVLFSALTSLYLYARLFLFSAEREEIRFPRLVAQCAPFLVLLIVTPPLLSKDLYGYGILAWSTWWGRINPYLTPMAQVSPHPWLPLPGDPYWLHEVTPYGPLSILFSWVPLVLSRGNLLLFAAIYKALMTGIFVAVLLWVDRMKTQFPNDSRAAMANLPALLLCNPVILVNGVLEGHNDLLLACLVVLLLCFYARGNYPATVASLGVAAAVKVSVAPLLPLLWFRSGRLSLFRVAVSSCGVAALFVCALAPFSFAWRGVWEGLAMQSHLYCFYVCSPVTYFFDQIAPQYGRVGGAVLGASLVLVAAWVFLVRNYSPILFGAVTLCTLFLSAVRFLTPWYFLPPLALMAVASSSTMVNRVGVLLISAYSFSLYVKFWGTVAPFR